MSLMPSRGDRPSLPHHRPKARQRRLKLHNPNPPKYTCAAQWPAWTDRNTSATFVPPEEWPDGIARVRYTVPMSLATWPETTQYPLDGGQGAGETGAAS